MARETSSLHPSGWLPIGGRMSAATPNLLPAPSRLARSCPAGRSIPAVRMAWQVGELSTFGLCIKELRRRSDGSAVRPFGTLPPRHNPKTPGSNPPPGLFGKEAWKMLLNGHRQSQCSSGQRGSERQPTHCKGRNGDGVLFFLVAGDGGRADKIRGARGFGCGKGRGRG